MGSRQIQHITSERGAHIGRAVGMARHYDDAFHALIARVGGSHWRITRHAFATELAYLIER